MRVMATRALGVLLAGALACGVAGCHRPGPAERARLDFTLKDMNGRDVRLADFTGKPLVVNFWATWCGPCQLEIPELVDLSAKYRDKGLVIVGISIDDSPELIRKFAAQYKVPYPLLVGLDRDDVDAAFKLGGGIPMSVFIRRDGTVLGRLEGIATSAYWDRRIQALF